MKTIACRWLVVPFCLAASLTGSSSPAADPRPSWECLPDDTAVMVRLPRPAEFLETLRTRTKFGAVALGGDRMRRAWELAVEAWGGSDGEPGNLVELEERLAKHGLGQKDLEAAFAGDMGFGIVMHQREDLPPLAMILAWAEPGTESAERMVAAFHRVLEEAAEEEAAPQRVDLEMAGHPVTWASRPILRPDLGDVKLKAGAEGGLDPERLEELRKELEELAERAKQAPKVTVGKVHMFLARVGGRLLVGQTMPPPPANVRVGPVQVDMDADAAGGDDADPDRLSGTEEARGIFERFLAAHAGGDASPLADILQAPGMRAALPSGEPLIEMVLDPRPFLQAAASSDAEKARLAAVGLGDLGPVALRQTFEAGRMGQGIFVTLPAPRAGLCRILEQECDAAEVPSFVTSEVVDFTQVSLDLAQAYRTVKDFAIAEGGEQAANMFMTAEVQAQGWLGLELEAMLANIGSRHWILTYPSQVAAAVEEARRNREGAGGAAGAPQANRVAFVWKLAEDAPVQAVLPKIAALAGAQVVEEQGFQGIRLPGGTSVFAGQGHLVVAMGGDALEKTLAGIRNPPAGAASLREGDVPRKGADLVTLGPCRMFAVGDARRTGGMLGELRELVTALVPDDVEDKYRDMLAKAQSLVPPAEEMQGMFGVGATIMEVNDAGITLRSAWEMPAP